MSRYVVIQDRPSWHRTTEPFVLPNYRHVWTRHGLAAFTVWLFNRRGYKGGWGQMRLERKSR